MIMRLLKALLSKPTDLFIAILVIIILVLISKANCLYDENQELKLQLADKTIQDYVVSTKVMNDLVTSFNSMSKQYELSREENENAKQQSISDFNNAVKSNPIYHRECMDGAGVFAINEAINQTNASTTSSKR